MRDYLDELLGAMRQYRHNDDTSKGNPPKKGFVVAYNKKETDAIFRALQQERDEAVEALRELKAVTCEILLPAVRDGKPAEGWVAEEMRCYAAFEGTDAILAKHGGES